jgi:hypothetical protein
VDKQAKIEKATVAVVLMTKKAAGKNGRSEKKERRERWWKR